MKASVLVLLWSIAAAASADVYVYTDKEGRQVFTDSPPDGKSAAQIDVPHTNILDTPPDQSEKNDVYFQKLGQQQQMQEDYKADLRKEKAAAEKTLNDARTALDNAKVIRSGDIFPNQSGGVRYTEQYSNRVEAARQALNQAQSAYDDLSN